MHPNGNATRIRAVGMLVTSLGGLLLGLGALREWSSVGFPGDIAHNLDVSVHGTDLWEGKIALAAAVLALLSLLAMRMVGNRRRLQLGIGIMLLGLAGAIVATEAWIRSGSRFGGTDVAGKLARVLAPKLGLPFAEVLAQIQAEFAKRLRIDVKLGLPLTIAGGLLCVAGGALGVAWARRGGGTSAELDEEPDPGSRGL